jgi:hypothetical protein
MTLTLAAGPADASLAGAPDLGDGPVVALGEPDGGGASVQVRWLDRPPRPDDRPSGRLIAPAGEGLWRAAPWPAADALFDLPPAKGGAAILAGAEAGVRAAVAERAAARGVALEQVDVLDAGALEAASCVILAEAPAGALPARALAVLAAGRLLIVPRLRTSFGLEDGLDHLEFADPDEAVTYVEAFRSAPDAFARITAWGRVKAEPQRASVAYARLAHDLGLGGASA